MKLTVTTFKRELYIENPNSRWVALTTRAYEYMLLSYWESSDWHSDTRRLWTHEVPR